MLFNLIRNFKLIDKLIRKTKVHRSAGGLNVT